MPSNDRAGPSRYRAGSSHYEVLEVPRTADHDDIRRAYYRAARRWHPDRLVGLPVSEADQAEGRIRAVNQAWEVLGDVERRSAYDRQLRDGTAGTVREARPARAADVDDGVIRIDPRLLDPTFLAARRDAQLNEISNRSSAILRMAPLVALVGLLVAIFIFTAYARNNSGSAATTTVPGPSLGNGIEANVCVSVLTGPSLLARPCDPTADGRVIGARLPDGVCPLGTIREVELTNGAIACLAAVG